MLNSILQWFLRIFLGGLFKSTVTSIKDDAQHKVDAAQAQQASQKESDDVEIAVIQAQDAAKAKVDATPKPPDDPFGDKGWNAE